MPPPPLSTAPARSLVGGCPALGGSQDRLKIYQENHHILGSMFDPFWGPFGGHYGSLFAPFWVPNRAWIPIFVKNVDFHENL